MNDSTGCAQRSQDANHTDVICPPGSPPLTCWVRTDPTQPVAFIRSTVLPDGTTIYTPEVSDDPGGTGNLVVEEGEWERGGRPAGLTAFRRVRDIPRDQLPTPSHRLVLATLAYHITDEGFCWPTNRQIAHRTGLSEHRTRMIVRDLVEAGYVRKIERPRLSDGSLGSWTMWIPIHGGDPPDAPRRVHPQQAPPRIGPSPLERTRVRLRERDGWKCQLCGGDFPDGYVPHVDHIIPKSHADSTNQLGNLQLAHVFCNERKSDDRNWSFVAAFGEGSRVECQWDGPSGKWTETVKEEDHGADQG